MTNTYKTGSTIISIRINSSSTLNTFSVELFDDPTNKDYLLTQETVDNFLYYVNSNAYDNSIIHRSVKDFVIQGGGFVYKNGTINELETKPPVINEPGNSNLVWTISMAKVSGQENSATSEWFINLADNIFLDSQNGGFTVFGRLFDDGISLVNEMSSTNIYDGSVINGAFSTLPLWQYEGGNPTEKDYLIVEEIKIIGIKVGSINNNFVSDKKGFASIDAPAPVTVTAYEVGTETTLDSIKDYDGNLHAGDNLEETASSYKYQGMLDVNGDGIFEAIFTNKVSKRWVTAKVDSTTGQIDFNDNGAGGGTRVVGIYADPLIAEGAENGGFLSDGVTPAPANFGVSEEERFVEINGETVDRLALNSQVRFQNDLDIDNLSAKHSGDYDSDGVSEVYWKTNDGTAYLRALMHDDGNIRYANYQSEEQMSEYLKSNSHESIISEIIS